MRWPFADSPEIRTAIGSRMRWLRRRSAGWCRIPVVLTKGLPGIPSMTTAKALHRVNAGCGVPDWEFRHKVAPYGTVPGLQKLDLHGVKGCNSSYQPLAIPKSRMPTGISVPWYRAPYLRDCHSLRMNMDMGWARTKGSIE